MLLLGIDVGTSSIKVSVVDVDTQQAIASAQYPEGEENKVISSSPGWAEQNPDLWWEQVQLAIKKLIKDANFNAREIAAIGIAYQMHGLVVVDEKHRSLRNSIIWCDSRAVEYGEKAFSAMGSDYALSHLLNSPGNFTAAKWAWVKEHDAGTYSSAAKIMLPGDYIALRLTGTASTSISALSEGIFWDFQNNVVSEDVIRYFDFDAGVLPEVRPLFGEHGRLREDIALQLGLTPGIPVTYKAGDQPNNALSLNVLRPGEVAATAGTSGVIYAVSDELVYDAQSRVNTFAHVNYSPESPRTGVLLCINGTGILNSWIRQNMGKDLSYAQMNQLAASIPAGSKGLNILPFGNGAERFLNNKIVGAHLLNLDFNLHNREHVFRAAQEGVAYSFRYGLDIIRSNGINPSVIRAGKANMFQSELFTQIFVNITGVPVELYHNDGSVGAAIGAGIGAGIYASAEEAFSRFTLQHTVVPEHDHPYQELYQQWLELLEKQLNHSSIQS